MSVEYKLDNGVARVTINRPERMNAVDLETEAELEQIWQSIEEDETVRCVILTGAGDRAFSAGADLKSDNGLTGLEYWACRNPAGFGGISLRRTLNVPVIARVNGLAMGGGMEMVLGCDIVIAAEQAYFGLPEAKVGRLPLEGGMVLLQRLIPNKIAAGLMMTGRRLTSAEAFNYGLVNKVVPMAELDREVDEWVSDIVSCAPLSIAAIKQTIASTGHLPPNDAQALRTTTLISALTSEDSNEGVAAFRDKRAPVWRGRQYFPMTLIIKAECVDIKDGDCTQVCPVDCIYEGGRMFYIHPVECIECGLCESICPVDAIRYADEVTQADEIYVQINREYFEESVTGLGDPGGWNESTTTTLDHPLIAELPPNTEVIEKYTAEKNPDKQKIDK